MNTKSKALQLADWLEEQYDPTGNQDRAAAELRRLQTENQAKDVLLRQALEAFEEYQEKGAPFMSCDRVANAIRQHLESE